MNKIKNRKKKTNQNNDYKLMTLFKIPVYCVLRKKKKTGIIV